LGFWGGVGFFFALLLRELGSSSRPAFTEIPPRFSVSLAELVEREPALRKGILLGFSSHDDAYLLFLRAKQSLIWLDVLFVSPAILERVMSVEVGRLDVNTELHEYGCTVYEHDFFCVVLTRTGSPICNVTFFGLSSSESMSCALSANQAPVVEMCGKFVFLCVGSDVHIFLVTDFRTEEEDSFLARHAVVREARSSFSKDVLCVCLLESVAIEDIAGSVAASLRSSNLDFENAMLEDFETALWPCDGLEEKLIVCITLRIRRPGPENPLRFVWVKAGCRPGNSVSVTEAKAVQ
jgi:hypothetical protein